uniref:Uncharacterized protein n=1 Tax=Timema douglasi TaxID=61478 RepID=A0A7R8VP07_TIMDO|nr:unnamed protein product [Timema douglasi]
MLLQFFVHESQTHQHYDVVGYACAVTATLFTAFNMVVMRKCKDIHFSVVVHTAVIVVPTGGERPSWNPGSPPRRDHRATEGVAAVGTSSRRQRVRTVGAVARALSMEGAGRVAVTRSLDIILAFLLQVFIFGEIPDWLSVLGAFFVLVCVIGMGLEEHIHYLASLVP